MVMVRGGSSASFRRSSDDMDDLGRSMHEDEPDRLILDYKLRCAEIYLCCVYSLAPDGWKWALRCITCGMAMARWMLAASEICSIRNTQSALLSIRLDLAPTVRVPYVPYVPYVRLPSGRLPSGRLVASSTCRNLFANCKIASCSIAAGR